MRCAVPFSSFTNEPPHALSCVMTPCTRFGAAEPRSRDGLRAVEPVLSRNSGHIHQNSRGCRPCRHFAQRSNWNSISNPPTSSRRNARRSLPRPAGSGW